jgi:hypothetical protein
MEKCEGTAIRNFHKQVPFDPSLGMAAAITSLTWTLLKSVSIFLKSSRRAWDPGPFSCFEHRNVISALEGLGGPFS